ncbi:MAG: AsmA family protein [Candidatus Scalindua sediminis]|nr:AsmA family protein [Candidatus Scalindua sediminis]
MPEERKKLKSKKTSKRRWPKIVGISIGGVIGVLAIIVSLIPTIVSSDMVKNEIISTLEEILNREVRIDDINMSWSSGFDIKNIHIKEREGLPGDTFLKVDRILCDIKLLPLLRKQIKIRSLVIDNPEIVLQRGKKGISKYEPAEAIPSLKTMEKRAPEVVEKAVGEVKYALLALPFLLYIELNAKINNGKFAFIDHRLGEETIIKNFNTTLNIESIDKPIEFKSVFDIETKDKTEHADIFLHVSLAEDGKINLRNANGTFNLKTGFARIIGDFDMARFSGKGGTGLDFLMNVDLREFTEKFAGILGLPEGMQMQGVINSKITAEGQLDEVISIDGITEIVNLNISGGPFEDKPIREPKIRFFQNVDIDMVNNDITLREVGINTSFIEVKSSGTLNKNRVIDLNMFLVVPDVKKLMDNLHGIVSLPRGLSVSGKAAGEINVKGNIDEKIKLSGKTILYGVTATGGPLKNTRISNLDLKLIHTLDYDKTEDSLNIEKMDVVSDFLDMSSKGKITNLSKEKNIDYELSLNMDLDNIKTMFAEMLPTNMNMTGKGMVDLGINGKLSTKDNLPARTGTRPNGGAGQAGGLSGWYENINFNGNIYIDTIKYDTYKITDLKSKFQLDDGLFTTKDFVFKLNEGQGNISAKANLKEDPPTLDFNLNLSDVRINQKIDTLAHALAYAMPVLPASDGQISGMLNLMLNANGKGLSWQDGLSKSLNAVGEINIKDGYIKGDKIISNILKKEKYRFDDIVTQFKINDEKIFVDNLRVNSKDFNIGLSGWTSFDGQIEYSADADVVGKYIGGDAEKILGMLGKGSKLPIVITGTVNNPRLAFKWPKPQEIGNFLGGLFGGRKDLKRKTEEVKEPTTETFNEEEKEKKTAEASRETRPEKMKKEDIVEKLFKSLFK